MIKRSIELKLNVVHQDKKEAGLRELLNFGHTVGHAIEFSYKGKLLHGECVAIGMALEIDIMAKAGKCSYELKEKISEVCKVN